MITMQSFNKTLPPFINTSFTLCYNHPHHQFGDFSSSSLPFHSFFSLKTLPHNFPMAKTRGLKASQAMATSYKVNPAKHVYESLDNAVSTEVVTDSQSIGPHFSSPNFPSPLNPYFPLFLKESSLLNRQSLN